VTAADTVFVRGAVLAEGVDVPRRAAVAVHGGRITAVGSDREIHELVGPRTEVVDVTGGLLLALAVLATQSPTYLGPLRYPFRYLALVGLYLPVMVALGLTHARTVTKPRLALAGVERAHPRARRGQVAVVQVDAQRLPAVGQLRGLPLAHGRDPHDELGAALPE